MAPELAGIGAGAENAGQARAAPRYRRRVEKPERSDETMWVESVSGPDGQPVVQVSWRGLDWYPSVADVRATAIDLVTAAAYAEMMMELIATVGVPSETAAAAMTSMLASTGRKRFGTPGTIDMLPAGSTKRREAVVLLRRRTTDEWDSMVSPAEARDMALGWLGAAEATESDMLLARAMRDTGVGRSDHIDAVFARMKELRG